jgi:hypothetical protein
MLTTYRRWQIMSEYRLATKLVREGQFAAEVEVELLDDGTDWVPTSPPPTPANSTTSAPPNLSAATTSKAPPNSPRSTNSRQLRSRRSNLLPIVPRSQRLPPPSPPERAFSHPAHPCYASVIAIWRRMAGQRLPQVTLDQRPTPTP